ncbi:MAG: transposase [Sedimenticola sp.]
MRSNHYFHISTGSAITTYRSSPPGNSAPKGKQVINGKSGDTILNYAILRPGHKQRGKIKHCVPRTPLRSDNRTKGNTHFLNNLRNSNRRIHRAWVLKDEFEHFWNYSYRGSAEKFIKSWMTTALKSRIPSLKKFVNTLLHNHLDHVLTFIDRRLTNAVGEGLNRVIKIVKNRASGFRGLGNFADMIYLTTGDLDNPAQIPSNLHTL